MDGKDVVICTILGLLGLISAAAGFAAEAKRLTPSQFDSCQLPPNPAMFLAFAAALALLIARIIIDISTRCICCRKKANFPSNVNWKVARASWSAFVTALVLLLFGALYSSKSPDDFGVDGFDTYSCTVFFVKPGVFAIGACCSLTSVILGIITCASFSSAKKSSNQPVYLPGAYGAQGGIPGVHPQCPPQTTAQPA